MEAYVRTNRSSVIVNICLSGVLLPASLLIAFFTFRLAKALHLTASWYLVGLATACLAGFNASVFAFGIATIPMITSGGPWPDITFTVQRIVQPLMTVFFGLYGLSTFVACRTAFWEITANPVFQRHNKARWHLLAFDLLIVVLGVYYFATNAIETVNAYRGRTNEHYIHLRMLNQIHSFAVWAVQYVTLAGYVNAAVGMYFVRQWTQEYQYGVTLADTMFRLVAPGLVSQVLILVPAAVFGIKVVFYTSVVWRVQQVIVTGLLAWTMWKYPITYSIDEEPVLPPQALLWAVDKKAAVDEN
ncbi:hypothetical protein EXIGLDRAFT_774759 [Exidia glandulosa HHB12029]|uniref:Uncharacterized protein n=1 Tax=Exidia glandulosa HHB12029 TaxID=1314781 RepID=A0A165ZWL9_EXIGL|nr:hypothetical protein EXIGLDRAFT_774759 [Exidia glandulosa HHB12029]